MTLKIYLKISGTRQGHGLMKLTAEEVTAYIQSLPTVKTNSTLIDADPKLRNITPRSLLLEKITKLNFGEEKLDEKVETIVSIVLHCYLFTDAIGFISCFRIIRNCVFKLSHLF